jgi:hypothetical protein
MRLSARVAEGIINDEQLILPGYSLNHVFFDDKCDSTESSQIVLREMASTTKYIGLGGSGCSAVCAGTAFVAASIRMPYLSYECAGSSLSDTTAYPDLTRFGTVTTHQVQVMKAIGTDFADWSFISVVSGDPSVYREVGERLVADLQDSEISSDYRYGYEDKWEGIVSMLESLRLLKRRSIFVMGSEAYFRKIICASILVGSNKGIAWLSEGAWRETWWTKTDAMIDSHISWIKEDSEDPQLKEALADFKRGWNTIAEGDEAAFKVLQPIYATPLLDEEP